LITQLIHFSIIQLFNNKSIQGSSRSNYTDDKNQFFGSKNAKQIELETAKNKKYNIKKTIPVIELIQDEIMTP
jgi:hypothetical protein